MTLKNVIGNDLPSAAPPAGDNSNPTGRINQNGLMVK